MSLFALPVTATDSEGLQLGIRFFMNPTEATNEASAINADTPGGPTVYSYAVQLLASQISLAQVAMADSALMEGATVAVGDAGTPNTLALFTTQFLPAQVANALAHGFNPTVYAARVPGSGAGEQCRLQYEFRQSDATALRSLSPPSPACTSMRSTGGSPTGRPFIRPIRPTGLTAQQAAYGATFGDAIGTALLNPTPIGPSNMPAGLPSTRRFNTIQNEIYNALKDNGEGSYAAGVAIGALPHETPLQGRSGRYGVFLTQGIDTPTSGFSLSPTGTPLLNGFTATAAGQVFNAQPFVTALGLANNTLNTGIISRPRAPRPAPPS